jgi:hypothetical protein
MIFGALVGWSVSPHHQCYQHAGHVLNAADVKNAWTTDFFRSPAAMDAAARGDDPRYERAVVVHRLDDLERGKKTSGHHVRFCQI